MVRELLRSFVSIYDALQKIALYIFSFSIFTFLNCFLKAHFIQWAFSFMFLICNHDNSCVLPTVSVSVNKR